MRMLLVGNRLFNGRVRVTLVGAQSWMIIRGLEECLASGVGVFLKSLHQGFRRVKLRDDVRPSQFVPDVVMPDDLAIS